jgi:hypothetical protein
MEQFDERILKTVELPNELCEPDLFAVARVHFSGLADDYLSYVVGKALATERNFVSDIEKIATLAKDNAREHERNLPSLADIESAIADVLPSSRSHSTPASATPRPSGSSTRIPRRCKPLERPLPARTFERKPLTSRTRNTAPSLAS